MGAFNQPVAVFGRPASALNSLHEVGVAGTQSSRLRCPDDPAEQALVVKNDGHGTRRWVRRRRPLRATMTARPVTRRWLGTRHRRLRAESMPVEADVRMSVFEGLTGLVIEGPSAHLDVGGRPK